MTKTEQGKRARRLGEAFDPEIHERRIPRPRPLHDHQIAALDDLIAWIDKEWR